MIYYYSATGNTLNIARMVAEKTGDKIMEIHEAMKLKEEIQDQVIGIFFPTFASNFPKAVEEFIDGRDFSKASYIYTVATCGGGPGNSLANVHRTLQRQGRSLNYGKIHYTVDNSYIMRGTGPSYSRDIFLRDEQVADDVAQAVMTRLQMDTYPYNPAHEREYAMIQDDAVQKVYAKTAQKEKCTACGVCAKVCPTENITIAETAIHGNNCEQCFGCLHWCPEGAIDMVGNTVTKDRQYHHPNVSVSEIISGLGR